MVQALPHRSDVPEEQTWDINSVGVTPLWWLFRALCDERNRFRHAGA